MNRSEVVFQCGRRSVESRLLADEAGPFPLLDELDLAPSLYVDADELELNTEGGGVGAACLDGGDVDIWMSRFAAVSSSGVRRLGAPAEDEFMDDMLIDARLKVGGRYDVLMGSKWVDEGGEGR